MPAPSFTSGSLRLTIGSRRDRSRSCWPVSVRFGGRIGSASTAVLGRGESCRCEPRQLQENRRFITIFRQLPILATRDFHSEFRAMCILHGRLFTVLAADRATTNLCF